MGNCCSLIGSNSSEKETIKHISGDRSEKSLCQSIKNKAISPSFLRAGRVLSPTNEEITMSSKYSSNKIRLQTNSVSITNSVLRNSQELRKRLSSQERMDVDESKILSLFDHYKEENEDSIQVSGIEQLCQDLNLEPTDFRVLLLAWKLNAAEMCKFTKKEFVDGCKNLKADSVRTIQSRLSEVEQLLTTDNEKFRDLYRFTYGFGLDLQDGQRTLPLGVALELWQLVFSKSIPVFMDEWISFLKYQNVKGISRDTWNMFLYLVENIKPDFCNYDDSEAWPSLFDEFVEYKARKNESVGS